MILSGIILFGFGNNAFAFQEEDLIAPRLSLGYFKDSQNGPHLRVKARVRAKRGYDDLANLKVNVYQIGEEDMLLGDITTGMDGVAIFKLDEGVFNRADSSGLITAEIRIEDQKGYEDSSADVEFSALQIEISFAVEDSVGYVTAKLTNPVTGEAVSEEDINFYVRRSFRPLTIGDDFYTTDEEGIAKVEIPSDIPAGFDGKLTVGIFMDDHYLFGTIREEQEIEYGPIPTLDQAYFERTMWGTRDKTPLWLLIFPNLIILGVWGVLLYLAYKLYIISKIKN